jgi:hypothetical protein
MRSSLCSSCTIAAIGLRPQHQNTQLFNTMFGSRDSHGRVSVSRWRCAVMAITCVFTFVALTGATPLAHTLGRSSARSHPTVTLPRGLTDWLLVPDPRDSECRSLNDTSKRWSESVCADEDGCMLVALAMVHAIG